MESKTKEAAAISAAMMLARMAELRFDRGGRMPAARLGHYLHAPAAQLLVVPAVTRPCPGMLDEAVALHDADALVVRTDGGRPTDVSFGVVLRGSRPFRAAPLRLWLGGGAPAHLVPDDPADSCVALMRVGLRGCEVPPWSDERDREAGLTLGLAEISRVLGSR